ncbi:MAG TPA: nickel pincer cofactor biosynthesis protein LarB [Candidatus Acidoferrum sp.]|nr:nickel pincer cofactor biosynthesis protein LarB [Candidatus Acidoferrum sp.]
MSVAERNTTVEEATDRLRDLAFSDLGFARVDHHRELRQGVCEVVYAEGKTIVQLVAIVKRLLDRNLGTILVTRAATDQVAALRPLAAAAGLPLRETRSGAVAIMRQATRPAGQVLILTGGTADLPVAEEAALTAAVVGAEVELQADVGVAGLHRLAAIRPALDQADVVVVVAGMEGALASVVGGLVACPVIACPTSVGYGASFGGLAALLSMLSSCAPGVVCVNIDDGVGAGYAAGLIARRGRT